MNRNEIVAVIVTLLLVGVVYAGYRIGSRKRCEPVLIERVIQDTTLAVEYKRQADHWKVKADSLAGLKPRVRTKYDTVYRYIPMASDDWMDSVIRVNR